MIFWKKRDKKHKSDDYEVIAGGLKLTCKKCGRSITRWRGEPITRQALEKGEGYFLCYRCTAELVGLR